MDEKEQIKKQALEQAEFSILMEYVEQNLELRRCAKKLFLAKLIDEYTMNQTEQKFIEEYRKRHIIITKPFRDIPEDWKWMQSYLLSHLRQKKIEFLRKLSLKEMEKNNENKPN